MFDITQLKKVRQRLDMTQTEFAKYAGVSQSLITKIEAGKIDPKHSTVQRITQAVTELTHKHSPTVDDVMEKKILSAKPEDKVTNIIKKMQNLGISQVPVIEDKQPVGTLSERTILEAISEEQNIKRLKVEEIMEGAPPTVPAGTPLTIARHLLEYSSILLVVKRGDYAGVVTKADIIRSAL